MKLYHKLSIYIYTHLYVFFNHADTQQYLFTITFYHFIKKYIVYKVQYTNIPDYIL